MAGLNDAKLAALLGVTLPLFVVELVLILVGDFKAAVETFKSPTVMFVKVTLARCPR